MVNVRGRLWLHIKKETSINCRSVKIWVWDTNSKNWTRYMPIHHLNLYILTFHFGHTTSCIAPSHHLCWLKTFSVSKQNSFGFSLTTVRFGVRPMALKGFYVPRGRRICQKPYNREILPLNFKQNSPTLCWKKAFIGYLPADCVFVYPAVSSHAVNVFDIDMV